MERVLIGLLVLVFMLGTMYVAALTTAPSYGLLNAVSVSSLEPVTSIVRVSPSISTLTLTGRSLPRFLPSSSRKPSSAS